MDELFDMDALPIIAVAGTCVLIIFKAAGWITWDWVWVLSPTWILLAIIFIIPATIMIVGIIGDMIVFMCKKSKK